MREPKDMPPSDRSQLQIVAAQLEYATTPSPEITRIPWGGTPDSKSSPDGTRFDRDRRYLARTKRPNLCARSARV